MRKQNCDKHELLLTNKSPCKKKTKRNNDKEKTNADKD